MKNRYQVLLVILLTIGSFFYTKKVTDFIRNTDPIMKNIKKSDSKFRIKAINAKVSKKRIIPGVAGKEIDYDKSYVKMKKYGAYNESLTVFKEVEPTISIDDYYDRYIQEGSGINNDVSLVFNVRNNDNIESIVNTLNDKGVVATFFIDGLWLENNYDLASRMAEEGHELEILSYNDKYSELYFSSSLKVLNEITNLKPKYCTSKYDNKEVLNLCSRLGLHTIIPTIITGNYPYNDIKSKLNSGSIIGFDIISSTKIELSTIIDYIRQKGYIINTLDNLLSEAGNIK